MKTQLFSCANRKSQNHLMVFGLFMLLAALFAACDTKSPLVVEQPQDPAPYMFFAPADKLAETAAATPEAAKPDLLPAPTPGNFQFCGTDNQGNLLVFVKNIGKTPSIVCRTMVEFTRNDGTSVKVFQSTPALGLYQIVTLKFKIPAGGYDPDLDFSITVDSNNRNAESNENNNTVIGKCIGG